MMSPDASPQPGQVDGPQSAFEIGEPHDDDEEYGDGFEMNGTGTSVDTPSINAQIANGNGEHSERGFQNDEHAMIQDDGDEDGIPSPYKVFRTPVDLDFAEGSVVAPCDLPEGHVLRVDLGRGRILVTQVPFGGVRRGGTFYSPYRIYDKPDDQAREYEPSPESPSSRTVGTWRASLCGCCEFGPCHPSFLGAFICQCFLLSQVMTRMHLNWIGLKSPPSVARKTLDGVFLTFAIFYFFRGITVYFWVTDKEEDESADEAMPLNLYSLTLIVDFFFIIYLIIVSTRGRSSVRHNYRIPGNVLSDCCTITICHPCALSQMARQSANYREHGSRWCSDTGVGEEYDREYGLNIIEHPRRPVPATMDDRDLI